MAKKEINIFNISFLDLLSGALGAVIILYIIIPQYSSGFVLGPRTVFLIDISGSMGDNNKITEVKSGLKMLLSTLDETFSVDIIAFPNQHNSDSSYTVLWNKLQPMNDENKLKSFKYIYELEANGGTPVNKTILDALENYSELSDIVLLCDGEPSDAEIPNIISNVKNKNIKNIRINTIGVGKEYLENSTKPIGTVPEKVAFLRNLAEQHKGFFIGF